MQSTHDKILATMEVEHMRNAGMSHRACFLRLSMAARRAICLSRSDAFFLLTTLFELPDQYPAPSPRGDGRALTGEPS